MNQKYKSAVVTFLLLLAAFPAFANHGLEAMGKAIEILLVVTVIVTGLTCTAFIIAGRNISRKSKKLRIISSIFSIPLALLTFVAFTFAPIAGFICGGVLVLLWLLIYQSFEPYQENGNAG